MAATKKPNSYHTGIIAEILAIFLLTMKLYRVIGKRYKTKVGEIDIIALRGKTIIFVEVKKRKNPNGLFESITQKQQARIVNAANVFLTRNQQFAGHKKRFDAIFITPNLFPVHIKNAWHGN